jgi:hypothetical protein
MAWTQFDRTRGDAPNAFAGVHMEPTERAKAQEQMDRATVIAQLVLAIVARIRNGLKWREAF